MKERSGERERERETICYANPLSPAGGGGVQAEENEGSTKEFGEASIGRKARMHYALGETDKKNGRNLE